MLVHVQAPICVQWCGTGVADVCGGGAPFRQVPFAYYKYRGLNVMLIPPYSYSFEGGVFYHYYTKVGGPSSVSCVYLADCSRCPTPRTVLAVTGGVRRQERAGESRAGAVRRSAVHRYGDKGVPPPFPTVPWRPCVHLHSNDLRMPCRTCHPRAHGYSGIPVGSDDVLNLGLLTSVRTRIASLLAADSSAEAVQRAERLKHVLLRGAPSEERLVDLVANASASPVVSGNGFPCAPPNWTRLWSEEFVAQGHRFVAVSDVMAPIRQWERPCKITPRWREE